ncbi:hypothetical protein [Rhizobium sp. TH135]|uniref:hypothetical protein n=1 Tax=Rhizobium sp. TH135 TaxID=2067451 RepID=UPI001559A01A|nr:hypothetical protein [Rhizobium sp. TH135]
MNAIQTLLPTDRLLLAVLIALTAATILLTTEAHAFCNLFCIHGMPVVDTEICAGRG